LSDIAQYLRDRTRREGDCWIWTKSCSGDPGVGYGQVGYAGRRWSAHRLMYTLAKGPIPPGMVVCHSCDVSTCINPDHLWLGTHRDNMADRVRKRKLQLPVDR